MQAEVDKALCVGCGMCVSTCPEAFCLGKDGLAESVGKIPAYAQEDVWQTAGDCPVGAISIRKTDDGILEQHSLV